MIDQPNRLIGSVPMPLCAASIETGGQGPRLRIDPVTREALQSFQGILAAKCGPHLRSLYLFGSRARGDHRPDNDIDIAVFLDEATDPIGEQFDLIERGYAIVLDTGANIQPWVFAQASPSDPDHHRAAHLVSTIRREGIPL